MTKKSIKREMPSVMETDSLVDMFSVMTRPISEAEKRVGKTVLKSGKVVSTVRLACRCPGGIYETMVFPGEDSFHDLDMARYETVEEAKAGHDAMVKKWEDQ